MEFLALLGIGVLITALVIPWIALAKASSAQQDLAKLRAQLAQLSQRLDILSRGRPRVDVAKDTAEPLVHATPTPPAPVAKAAPITPAAVKIDSSFDLEALANRKSVV